MSKKSRQRKRAGNKRFGKKKSAIGWFDIPLEMRELFLTGIKLSRYGHPTIHVGLGESSNDRYHYNYCLKFCDLHDKNEPKFDLIYYETNFNLASVDGKWTETRDGSSEEAVIDYLNEILKTCGKRIESFQIDDKTFVDSKIDMKQLTNLNYLCYECGDIRENGLMEFSQISQIDECYLGGTQFTFEEVLQFKGSVYYIRSDDFNNEHIEKYLKMLKNGEIHRNMQYLDISSKYRPNSADGKKLAKSVDAFDFQGFFEQCRFKFLLNYEREQKCYCYVTYFPDRFFVDIVSHCYDEVIKNREPLID